MINKYFYDDAPISGAEKDGLYYSVNGGEAAVTGCTGDMEYVDIPDFFSCYPVTELRDNAFCKCSMLKGIAIPDTVTRIGHHCFYACASLESVKLPSGLEKIGEGCFCGCDSLAEVVLPETLEELPPSCFRACCSLKGMTLPGRITHIGGFCFSSCDVLKSVDMGENVAEIGEGAFFMCPELDSIYIPSSCVSIGLCAVGYGSSGTALVKDVDITILGEKGSAAEEYACRNGLEFSAAGADAGMTERSFSANDLPTAVGPAVFGALIIAFIGCFFLRKGR